MKKITELVLMLCLVLSGALCYAYDEVGTENMKGGGSILVKKTAQHGGTDKSGSIVPTINGKVLSVSFTENLGQVDIEVTTSTGGYVQANSCITPNGIQFYIPNAGDYIVTFTLSNGDMYAGEFTVSD